MSTHIKSYATWVKEHKNEIMNIRSKDRTDYVYDQLNIAKVMKQLGVRVDEYTYFYADTEADVTHKYHIPYCISYKQRGEKDIHFIFFGSKCTDKFLDILRNNAVVYFFHNLGYDGGMF